MKLAVVAGTSPNIGGGIALGVAAEGARLLCIDIRSDSANRCAQSVRDNDGEAIGGVCDVIREG